MVVSRHIKGVANIYILQRCIKVIRDKHEYQAGVAESNAYLGAHKTGDSHQTDKQTNTHTGVCIELLRN